jgi:hypothetical protein
MHAHWTAGSFAVILLTFETVDGKLAPLKVLIESLPGGPMVNLASPNEHVP